MLVLKPSKIEGVGVFTTRSIRKGAKLPLFDDADWRLIRRPRPEERELVRRFCLADEQGYHAPADWNRMSIGWYLNHADEPNVEHQAYVYRAARSIRPGEELTVDYDTLEED